MGWALAHSLLTCSLTQLTSFRLCSPECLLPPRPLQKVPLLRSVASEQERVGHSALPPKPSGILSPLHYPRRPC